MDDKLVNYSHLFPTKMTFRDLITIFLICLLLIGYSISYSLDESREHKVHNIVLYPDKNSWCNATQIIQVVNHPGCTSVQMDNHVCVGMCFSYVVPRTIPSSPGYVAPYCDSCQPVKSNWKRVTLNCPDGDFKDKTLTKYVEVINDCVCASCMDQSMPDYFTPQLQNIEEENLENNLIEDSASYNTLNSTDLMTSLLTNDNNNNLSNETSNAMFKILVSEILRDYDNNREEKILLQNSNTNAFDRDALNNFLSKLEGTDHNIMQLIKKKIEEETNVKINMKRLPQILIKLKHNYSSKLQQKEILKREEIPEMIGPHHSLVFPKDTSGLFHHLRQPTGIEQETATPTLDIISSGLKPATPGSEISYHDYSPPSPITDEPEMRTPSSYVVLNLNNNYTDNSNSINTEVSSSNNSHSNIIDISIRDNDYFQKNISDVNQDPKNNSTEKEETNQNNLVENKQENFTDSSNNNNPSNYGNSSSSIVDMI